MVSALRVVCSSLTYMCGSPGEQSNIVSLHVSIVFEVLQRRTFVKGGAHMHCV